MTDIDADGPSTLPPQQLRILQLIAEGNSNAAIGRRVHLSEDTVKANIRRLFHKLGAQDRAHAVAIGFKTGILTDQPHASTGHAEAVPGQPIPRLGLTQPEPRGPHTDRHIAACFAAQACPCRTNATWQWPTQLAAPIGGAQ